MKKFDLIRMGLKNLLRRKLRTFLTTLGIIIGTISIVVMISIGMGMQKSINDEMEQFGTIDIIEVYPSGGDSDSSRFYFESKGSTTKEEEENNIKDEDIATFHQIEGVENITPIIQHYVTLSSTKYENTCNAIGMNPDFFEYYGIEIEEGRTINEDDKNAILFGLDIPYNFYNPKNYSYAERYNANGEMNPPPVDPFEDRIKLSFDSSHGYNSDEKMGRPVLIKPVGSIKEAQWGKFNYSIYMDIKDLTALKDKHDKITAYKDYNGRKPKNLGYEKILLYVPNRNDVKVVQEEIEKLGFNAISDIDMLESTDSMAKTIKMVFGGIGGIALLVAAIGITNTMVMAIYERRKEIGVMKVTGASIKDIKKLFLFESATLGLLGGLLGILISLGISWILNNLQGENFMRMFGIYSMGEDKIQLSIIPPWLIILALAFTSFIGLISGYLPARKAMKLSALEAIKTD